MEKELVRVEGSVAAVVFQNAENGYTVLKTYLDQQVEAGTLSIDDTEIAAKQFIELSSAGIFKGRLFGMCEAPSADRIEKNVRSAIHVFLAAYGRKTNAD